MGKKKDERVPSTPSIPSSYISTTSLTQWSIVPLLKDMSVGFCRNAAITAATAPIIHPGFNISTVAAREGCSSWAAGRRMYEGVGEVGRRHSFLNIFRGVKPYAEKEALRLGYKSVALQYKGAFENALQRMGVSSQYHSVCFAGMMSTAELLVQPFDNRRTQQFVGQTDGGRFQGGLGNFSRQFGTWGIWSQTNKMITPMLKEQNIDPYSFLGLSIRGFVTSSAFTSVVYPVERVTREFQFMIGDGSMRQRTMLSRVVDVMSGEFRKSMSDSMYLQASRSVVRTGGVPGLYAGFGAKLMANTALAFGANAMAGWSQVRESWTNARSWTDWVCGRETSQGQVAGK